MAGWLWVPLIGQLSNFRFLTTLDELVTTGNTAVSVRVDAQLCRCGCQQTVPEGRKFVNQAHFDRWRGVPPAIADQLVARFRQGVPVLQLARESGIALTTLKRLLR